MPVYRNWSLWSQKAGPALNNLARILTPRLLSLVAGLAVALTAVEAADDNALEYCSSSSPSTYSEPIRGALPVNNSSSDRALARFVMPYALLAGHAINKVDVDVGHLGFYPGPDSNQLFLDRRQGELFFSSVSGFKAAIYVHCQDDAIVIVYGKTNTKDPRDWISAVVRYYSGGESELALSLLDAVQDRYPGYAITLGKSVV